MLYIWCCQTENRVLRCLEPEARVLNDAFLFHFWASIYLFMSYFRFRPHAAVASLNEKLLLHVTASEDLQNTVPSHFHALFHLYFDWLLSFQVHDIISMSICMWHATFLAPCLRTDFWWLIINVLRKRKYIFMFTLSKARQLKFEYKNLSFIDFMR